jgi:hypothetical protein
VLVEQNGTETSNHVTTCGGWKVANSDLQGQGDGLDAVAAISVAHWNGDISLDLGLQALSGIGLEVR